MISRGGVKEGDLVMYRFDLSSGGEGLLLRRVIDITDEGVICKNGLPKGTNLAKWSEIYPVPEDYPNRYTSRQVADKWEKDYLLKNPK